MSHRLELVVEKQLWQHEQEPEGVHPVDGGLDGPAVPGLVWRVQQAVHSSSYEYIDIDKELDLQITALPLSFASSRFLKWLNTY